MATKRTPRYFNGVQAIDGSYLTAPLLPNQVLALALGAQIDRPHQHELTLLAQLFAGGDLGVIQGVDPNNLMDAGWGIIFPANDPQTPAVRAALAPLLALRREQAGDRYREFSGSAGYRNGETKLRFLARHAVGPGPVHPTKVPYYLLIAGNPEAIPFAFQYQLDVQYAVGRIWFETLSEYANYASTVLSASESRPLPHARAVFFGTANADDPPTQMSAHELVTPLATALADAEPGWQVETVVGSAATKARLDELCGGSETPSLLFTATHGIGFPSGHPLQRACQGALLCQDWPGPRAWHGRSLQPDFYFAAADVADSADLSGLIAVHFGCYSAGTPQHEHYGQTSAGNRKPIAPNAFLANLPTRLLSHPKGGALAVIGHVERAWGYSFAWEGAGRQPTAFIDVFMRLMAGHTVGAATEPLNVRYAELAAGLAEELELARTGVMVDEETLAMLWTATNDARSYVILGDPAVHIPLAKSDE